MSDQIGVMGYGVFIPYKRIQTALIVKARERGRKDLPQFLAKVKNGLMLEYKSVADYTEDVTTMATEAAENAIIMGGIKPSQIGSVVIGSESKPYAVGSTAMHIASFLGLGNETFVSDIEGACNSGMQSVDFVRGQIAFGGILYGLAIGADVAQASEGDPLEYAAGAGAGAFLLGKKDTVADIIDMVPYSSLTLDFFRREGMPVPKHFGRTTVEAYITHVTGAIYNLLRRNHDLKLSDFDAITFHQPSGYMPLKTCKSLIDPDPELFKDADVRKRIQIDEKFIERKVKPWLTVLSTGNTYAASTSIALANILDHSKPGDDILAVSYGSGAYSIATWLKVKKEILKKRNLVPTVEEYVNHKSEINLSAYYKNIKEHLLQIRRKFSYPRVIGELDEIEGDSVKFQLCSSCKRIYYPPRNRCLEWECPGELEEKSFPLQTKLNNFWKLTLKERLKSNFDILLEGKVLIVDSGLDELKKGMPLELTIRRLDYEGREGLIQYGPGYRPAFRQKTVMSG